MIRVHILTPAITTSISIINIITAPILIVTRTVDMGVLARLRPLP